MKLMKAAAVVIAVYLAYLIGWIVALVVGLSLSVLIVRAILVAAKEAKTHGHTDTAEWSDRFVGGNHLFEKSDQRPQ